MNRETILMPVSDSKKKYRGIRQRQWGKWVSEIRVPGTKNRLWLGSYATAEAAAMAHDTAVFFLRGPDENFNFPGKTGDSYMWAPLSPASVQRLASDAGMSTDARLTDEQRQREIKSSNKKFENCVQEGFTFDEDFCINDVEIWI